MNGKIEKTSDGIRLNFFTLSDDDFKMNNLPIPTPEDKEMIAEILQELLMEKWYEYLHIAYSDVNNNKQTRGITK